MNSYANRNAVASSCQRLMALAAMLVVLGALAQITAAGSLEGAQKNPVQEVLGKAQEVMGAIVANVQKAWKGFTEGQRDAGHLMVAAINEVRKFRQKLERDHARNGNAGDQLVLSDANGADQGALSTPAAPQTTSYESFFQLAMKEVEQGAPAGASAAERKSLAMKSVKRRTLQLAKSVFLDELLDLTKYILLNMFNQNPSQKATLDAVINRTKGKLIKYLLGVFVDFLPVFTGGNNNSPAGGDFGDALKQTLMDSEEDGDAEQVTTTENPYNWMLHNMID